MPKPSAEMVSRECQEQMKGLNANLMDKCLEYECCLPSKALSEIHCYDTKMSAKRTCCRIQVLKLFVHTTPIPYQMEETVQRWLMHVTTSETELVLWAGFWDGPGAEPNRTTKQALFDFAKMMPRQTLHLGTELGTIIQKNGDIEKCNRDPARDQRLMTSSKGFLRNIWSEESMEDLRSFAKKRMRTINGFMNTLYGICKGHEQEEPSHCYVATCFEILKKV